MERVFATHRPKTQTHDVSVASPKPSAALLHRATTSGPIAPSAGSISETLSAVEDVLRSPGQPLDPTTRASLEPRFGHDFSQVRVHADAAAGASARALGALAYTSRNHVVFGAGQHTGAREGQRTLVHELTHVVQQRRPSASQPNHSHEQEAETAGNLAAGAFRIPVELASMPGAIQCEPDPKKTPTLRADKASPKPPKAKHTLKVQIRISDMRTIVEEKGARKFGGLFTHMPKELSKRLIDQVRERLSFLGNEGFKVSVEFGQFSDTDLKVAGNIQVWMVSELEQSTKPGEVMKKHYGYKAAAADKVNEEFTNVTHPGPGHDFKEVGGITPRQIDDSVPGTSEPVFIKVPEIFSRDELTHYKEGKDKQEAELGVDEISATTSHEIGHVLRSEPDAGHAKGSFNDSKQSFPPRLMDTIGARGGWTTDDTWASPRLSTVMNDKLSKEAIDKLGGWPYVWDKLVLPNVGVDKVIRRARVTPDGGMEVYYNFSNLGYAEEEKTNMVEFLKGIEMSQEQGKWKKKK